VRCEAKSAQALLKEMQCFETFKSPNYKPECLFALLKKLIIKYR